MKLTRSFSSGDYEGLRLSQTVTNVVTSPRSVCAQILIIDVDARGLAGAPVCNESGS